MDKKDSQQPGPSGYNQNKSKSKQKEQKEKSKNKFRIFKGKSKSDKNQRHSSIDATLSRYRLPSKLEAIQQSHAVRKFVPASDPHIRTLPARKLIVYQPEPRISDDNDAVDIYLRTHIHQLHRRESLVNIPSHVNLTKELNKPKTKTDSIDQRRTSVLSESWRNCLESATNCTCPVHQNSIQPKSDWATLTLPTSDRERRFTNPRFQWFLNLEKTTKVDKKRLSDQIDDAKKDYWTLPFVWKKYRNESDYYLQN